LHSFLHAFTVITQKKQQHIKRDLTLKKTLAALLGVALSFTATAQTAASFLEGSHLVAKNTNGASAIIMIQACQANRKGISAYDFAQAAYKHYKPYGWSKAQFDRLIDPAYDFSEQAKGSDCDQLAINLIEGL
jgi:hypothetical protein